MQRTCIKKNTIFPGLQEQHVSAPSDPAEERWLNKLTHYNMGSAIYKAYMYGIGKPYRCGTAASPAAEGQQLLQQQQQANRLLPSVCNEEQYPKTYPLEHTHVHYPYPLEHTHWNVPTGTYPLKHTHWNVPTCTTHMLAHVILMWSVHLLLSTKLGVLPWSTVSDSGTYVNATHSPRNIS
eukprot:1139293-Pelagomonas_calceolata.AAC.11